MEKEEILHLSFNHEKDLLTMGTSSGFKVFRLYPLELIHKELMGNFKIVEAYESSHLLALVGAGELPAYSPRRLTIYNLQERTPICETAFQDTILAVRSNRLRIVAVLADSIYIYDTTTMKTQKTIHTVHNPLGLAALSPSHSSCYLVSPASEERGHLQIFDCFNMYMCNEVAAHKSPLAAVSINSEGTMCASASEKGTVIRVFSVPEAQKLFTFKRGMMNAQTYDLSFSLESDSVVSCSDTGTIHVYNLSRQVEVTNSWGSMLRSSIYNAASYIVPSSYRDSFETSRSYIVARTGFTGKYIAILRNELLVALAFDGKFKEFKVDLSREGEAVLQNEGNLSEII
mmetsp:Transcript_4648/g.7002  ORF Transcript_4648/g.7002 Transcript_4648/m.7002 type:complete len:344 (+) Transcript_4648:10-1041(+)